MPERQKAFAGFERMQPIDRNGRVRLMCRARGLRHQGKLTRAAVDVMAALCDRCNRGTGACFPSYETLAEDAGCARSTVAIALQALWAVGLIDWAHRLVRVREHCERSCRWVTKVMRTSNGYLLLDPLVSSKSDLKTRTPQQASKKEGASQVYVGKDRATQPGMSLPDTEDPGDWRARQRRLFPMLRWEPAAP